MKYPNLTFFQFVYLLTLIMASVFVFNVDTRDFGYTVFLFLGLVGVFRFFLLEGFY